MKPIISLFFIFSVVLSNPFFNFYSDSDHQPLPSEDNFISISKYVSERKLQTKIKGVGGHQENCIEFELKNSCNETLYVYIEPGRRVVSKDTTLQDIFIVKQLKIILFPKETKKVLAYGFCCEATMHSPPANSEFDLGFMTPPDWIKLAELINGNNFPVSAIQSAVWVMSDNHPISSIYHENNDDIDLLKRTVASLKGVELPWYSFTYEKDTAMLFSNRYDKIWGDIEYSVRNNSIVTINVRNKQGKLMTSFNQQAAIQGPGKYKFKLELPINNWPKGDYDLYIYEDFSNLILMKTFKL